MSLLICLSVFLNLKNAKMQSIAPIPTKDIPNREEYPCECRGLDSPKKDAVCCMKKENLPTTNPNAIIPRLVLIHAKKVLSLAK